MIEQSPDMLKEQGLTLFKGGDYDGAVSHFRSAAAAFVRENRLDGQAEMLNNIGVICRLQGSRQAAGDALNEAAVLFAELGDALGRAQVLGNLGDLHADKRDYGAAARYYGDSAALLASLGDGQKQAQVLRAYSLMQLRRRRWIEAIYLMVESLEARPRLSLFQRLFLFGLRLARKLLSGN